MSMIIIVLVGFGCGIWFYKQARKQNSSSAVSWVMAIFGFIFPVVITLETLSMLVQHQLFLPNSLGQSIAFRSIPAGVVAALKLLLGAFAARAIGSSQQTSEGQESDRTLAKSVNSKRTLYSGAATVLAGILIAVPVIREFREFRGQFT